MIIYLSGPISSRLDTYKEQFQKAYDLLSQRNHVVISPHFLPIGLKSHQDYMQIAHASLKAAEIIYLLKGWEDSPGARMELRWAMDMDKAIYLQGDTACNIKLFNNKPEPTTILLSPQLYQKVREGKITLNQARKRMGFEPIPYGDAPLTQRQEEETE